MSTFKPVAALCCALSVLAVSPHFTQASETWSATHSNLWDDYLNWSGGSDPDGTTDVTVSGSPVMASESARNLTFSGNMDLTIDPALNVPKYMVVTNNASLAGTVTIGQGCTFSAANITNAGTIQITNTGSNQYSALSSNLTNNGTVNDQLALFYQGAFTNNNTCTLSANASFIGYSSTFNQNAGTLSLAAGSVMDLYGAFNFNGGTVSGALPFAADFSKPTAAGGAILLHGGSLNINVSDGQDQTFNAVGYLALNTNIPVHTFVQGFGQTDSAFQLVSPTALTIDGGLVVRTLGAPSSVIYTNNQGTVTNNGFFITSGDAGSTLYVYSPFVNNGFVDVANTLYFVNNVANEANISMESTGRLQMDSARFNQDAGTLGTSGQDSFDIYGGGFNYNGGTVNLTLNLHNSFISLNVPDGQNLGVNAYGTTTINSGIPIHTTVFLLGAPNTSTGAVAYFASSADNSGSITVRADDGLSTAIVMGDGNGTLNNYGAFTLAHNALSGSFTLYGNLINYGTATFNSPSTFNRNVTNFGNFNIASNTTLDVADSHFSQNAGTLGHDGSSIISLSGSTFDFNGGRIYSTIYLSNSALSTSVLNGNGAVFNAYGTTTLQGDLAPSTSLNIVATPIASATLYAQNHAVNRGSIHFGADTAYGINFIIGDNSGVFLNAGTLNFAPAPGSFTSIYGNVVNSGGMYIAGYTLSNGDINNTGSLIINAGSVLEMNPGFFLYQAGTLVINGSLVLDDGAQIVPSGKYTFDVGGKFDYNAPLTAGDGATVQARGAGATVNIKGNLNVGGHIVAQGGGNIVAQGGGNIVGQGGGNIVGQGGGNIVAQGGGNIFAGAGSAILAQGGGNIVAQGGGNAVPHLTPFAQAGSNTPPSISDLTSSIIAQPNGAITLIDGNLQADNVVEIQSNATLSGYGNVTAALATSFGDITPANGTLTFNAPLVSNGGTLGGPSGLLHAANGLFITASTALHGTVQTSALTLSGSTAAWSSALDIRGAALILQPSAADKSAALTTFQDQLAYGRTHTTGILSSTLTPNTAIAFVDNAQWNQPTFRGATLDANSLLLAPALLGDANLDGKVDLNDLNTLLNHLGLTTPNWTDGNFDHAPTIDLTDLNAVLNHLGLTYASASSITNYQLPITNSSPIPEPTSLSLLATAALITLRPRRTQTTPRPVI